MKIIDAGATIGIIGGGQLGQMMAFSAKEIGYRIALLDPDGDSPCAQVADEVIVAPYHDEQAMRALAEISDVVTYEFENVDAATLRDVRAHGYFPQGVDVLETTQHRLQEKAAITRLGVPVARYMTILSVDDVALAATNMRFPAILKVCLGGYDGKGQVVVHDASALREAAVSLLQHGPLVLEEKVDFSKEISVIVTRSVHGEITMFPVAENEHRDNILHRTIVPARISTATAASAQALARRLAEGLNVVGTLAVEMFVKKDGTLYVNELAPRPHNSGHYTIEACKTSQFEQHIRAICGLPLGDTTLQTPAVMENILGDRIYEVPEQPARAVSTYLHLYGKKHVKYQRKMGHVTVLGNDTDGCLEILNAFWRKKALH
ncbi:5-(carboxyamino)imidazole ribonucleotide synthase [Shouchella lonarensis]|uniref:N5-carboxyaminoimidazole ribonucleotide synthase n=1 Tax=Shouchella lonarensis TaxID=1464122 RepID=A0A1G6MPP5_9BACI|nr:5-(carboxyamino)imidazole ribonucleotide synthase [Shouchella lonarensis]SDC57197.1 5-(carboxyamino)imidazole ribonucleotide synthase [Shouchella lonarensis]